MRRRLPPAVLPTVLLVALACAPDAPTGIPAGAVAARQPAGATGRTVHRPITDFLAGQGTWCLPGSCAYTPFPGIVNWYDPATGRLAIADYAGVGTAWLREVSGGVIDIPTRFEGTVTERVRRDGRTEVHVVLRASNVLAFTFDGDGNLVFGAPTGLVLAGAEPALGDAHLGVKYITTAPPGAPMPDLLQLLDAPEPGQELLQLRYHATATGLLRPAFEGVPEGTRGRLMIQQLLIQNTKSPRLAQDAWPVEFIKLQVIGGR